MVESRGSMYSESKLFVSIYLVGLAKSLSKSQPENHQIFVVNFCAGATKTDNYDTLGRALNFTPKKTPKTAAEGAETGVWLALLPKSEILERNCKLFGERQEIPFDFSPVFQS